MRTRNLLRRRVSLSALFVLLSGIFISTSSAQAAFQTSGLIANWIPSGLSSGSSTWTDAVNSTSLSLSNTTYNGSNGGYLGFNGTSSGAHAGSALSSFNNGHIQSEFFWVYPNNFNAMVVIAAINRPAANQEQYLEIDSTGALVFWDYDGGAGFNSVTSTSKLTSGQWNYVGFTKSTTSTATLNFYINGQLASTSPLTSTQNSSITASDFELGQDNRDNNKYFSGRIGQASLWNSALTATDIANNYAATNGNYINPSITSSSSSQSIYLTQPLASVTETNTGGTATYSISPTLPNGLSIDPNTGTISGTPTVASPNTSYTVTATNIAGTATLTFTLTVTQAGVVLTGPATIAYRQVATIQATPNGPTTLVFFANGKRIPACVRIVSSGSMVTCSFKPALQGPNSVYATFSISGITGRSNTMNIRATPRGTTR